MGTESSWVVWQHIWLWHWQRCLMYISLVACFIRFILPVKCWLCCLNRPQFDPPIWSTPRQVIRPKMAASSSSSSSSSTSTVKSWRIRIKITVLVARCRALESTGRPLVLKIYCSRWDVRVVRVRKVALDIQPAANKSNQSSQYNFLAICQFRWITTVPGTCSKSPKKRVKMNVIITVFRIFY